jgi:hypothetical protein
MFPEGRNRSELLRIGQNRSDFQGPARPLGFEISEQARRARAAGAIAVVNEQWAWVSITFLPRECGATGKPRKASGVVAEARAWGTRRAQGRLGAARSGSGRRPAAMRRFSSSRGLSGRRAVVGFIFMFSITVVLRVPASPGRRHAVPGRSHGCRAGGRAAGAGGRNESQGVAVARIACRPRSFSSMRGGRNFSSFARK